LRPRRRSGFGHRWRWQRARVIHAPSMARLTTAWSPLATALRSALRTRVHEFTRRTPARLRHCQLSRQGELTRPRGFEPLTFGSVDAMSSACQRACAFGCDQDATATGRNQQRRPTIDAGSNSSVSTWRRLIERWRRSTVASFGSPSRSTMASTGASRSRRAGRCTARASTTRVKSVAFSASILQIPMAHTSGRWSLREEPERIERDGRRHRCSASSPTRSISRPARSSPRCRHEGLP
jgi:hypothetical protein